MKVACLLITHLRAKAEMRRRPHLKDQPVLIVERGEHGGAGRSGRKSRTAVVDHFPAADAVSVGMSLEQALSRQFGAVVLEADEPHYRRVFRQVLTALQGISDRVEDAGLGVAYVALDGLEPMYGGEERLVLALLNAVPQNLQPRAGLGDGKFPALAAARNSEPLRRDQGPSETQQPSCRPVPVTVCCLCPRAHDIRPAPVRTAHPGAGGRHEPGPAGGPVRPGG